MNAVLIIPTGIGAEIGGHAGDAGAVARLMGTYCDILITHPNVVNASDINEMTPNTLYVEGSMLDSFLNNKINLLPVKKNKLLVAVNPPLKSDIVNSVNAARVTLGLEAEIVVLKTPLEMIAGKGSSGQATGEIRGALELIEQVKKYDFDALAVASQIIVDKNEAWEYLRGTGGVNLWGGVEAKLSKLLYKALGKPIAHAPIEYGIFQGFDEIVDPRMSAEVVSVSYIHCVLKGLYKAPRPTNKLHGLSVNKIDCLISPYNCYSAPHIACDIFEIPIIAVKENKTVLDNDEIPKTAIIVENYFEAIGVMQAIKEGISFESIRRPILPIKIHMEN